MFAKKIGARLDEPAKVIKKSRRKRMAMVTSIVLLSTSLAACESSQLLDVSGLLSSQPNRNETASISPDNTGGKPQVKADATASEAVAEKNTDLQGPVTTNSTNSKPFPSLSDQPEKPRETLNVAEKDREIRELENLSKTHVQSREVVLDNRAPAPALAPAPKKAKKPDKGGIFGLGWLGGGKSKASAANKKGGLTPPEKLRLSRVRPTNPDIEGTPDNVSTGSTSTPGVNSGLRTTPILPSVPDKEVSPPKKNVVNKPALRDGSEKSPTGINDRPSAQNPKKVLFSKGSRKLAPKQQKVLDEIARFRDGSGTIIYVLGFSQSDPNASSEANIDSQDMAISRANYVAEGLRKRGFPSDQVVVQIIDELVQKEKKSNAAMRRVEVYFENTQKVQKPVTSQPKRTAKKSPLDFLKGKPFEYSESEN